MRGTIEDNLCNNPYEDVDEVSAYYIKRKKLIWIIKIILFLSPFIVHTIVSDIVLRKYRSMFMFT